MPRCHSCSCYLTLLATAFVICSPAAARAVDVAVSPAPAWLDDVAQLRLLGLQIGQLESELATLTGQPVTVTLDPEINDQTLQLVTVVTSQPRPLRQLLGLVETASGLRCLVTDDGITVGPPAAIHAQQRAYHRIELGRWQPLLGNSRASTQHENLGLESIGTTGWSTPVGHPWYYPSDKRYVNVVDSIIDDWLEDETQNQDADVDVKIDDRSIHLLAISDEYQRLVAWLDRWQALLAARHSWRATFGLLTSDTGANLASGLVSPEEATTVRERLRDQVPFTFQLPLGRAGHAGRWQSQPVVAMLLHGDHGLQPDTDVIRVGRGVSLRADAANSGLWLRGAAAWVDLDERDQQVVRDASSRLAAAPEPIDTTATSDDEGTTVTVTVPDTPAPASNPGLLIEFDESRVWSWKPTVDVLLTADRAIVLTAEHPRGRAVLVIEPVEEAP